MSYVPRDDFEIRIERRPDQGWDGVLFVDGELVSQVSGRLGDVITRLVGAIETDPAHPLHEGEARDPG